MLFSRGVNCGRTAGRIEMPLGKNFRRPHIFSLEISGPKVVLLCKFSLYRGRSGPCQATGPEASASPASWMIRPCRQSTLHALTCRSVDEKIINVQSGNAVISRHSKRKGRRPEKNIRVKIKHFQLYQGKI